VKLRPSQSSPLRIFRMFSSSADARRQRRPTDVVILGASLFLLLLLGINAPAPTSMDLSLASLLRDLDGALGWFWPLVTMAALLWVLVLVIAPIVRYRQGRLRLLLDYGLAVALAVPMGMLVGAAAGTDTSTSVLAPVGVPAEPRYVPVRLAVLTALIVVASPHLTHPFRRVGRVLLVLGTVATVAQQLAYASGALAGVAVGLSAAAVVHLLRGSPGGLLTPTQVGEALLDLGITASSVSELPPIAAGEQRLQVRTADGDELLVKVLGRDAWEAHYTGSLWTSLTRRDEPPQLTATRRDRVTHEAMVSLLAERAGVPVLPVMIAGQGVQGEAILVSASPRRTLADFAPDEITDERLEQAWSALSSLHEHDITHHQITAHQLVERRDGLLAWSDLATARLAPTTTDVMLDRVQLLVSTWLLVGPDRAVDAAVDALGVDGLADTMPYLQDPALSPPLRKAMGTQWVLDDLRDTATTRIGTDEVPMVELRRVTAGSLVKMVLTVVIVASLAGLLAGVDFTEIAEELRSADVTLLLLALAVAPLAQVAFSFSTVGATVSKLPYLPVLVLQYAIQFIALVLPSTGARAALQIRFFERLGVPYGAAISMGLIDGLSGLVVQVSLLLIVALSSLPGVTTAVNPSTGGAEEGSDPSLLGLALLIAAVWAVVTLAIPRRRARALRAIPRLSEALKNQAGLARSALQVVKHPGKLTMMMGGNLGGQLVQAVVLGICLSAFGESVSLSQLILVNTFVSLFAGVMPVPGGVGIAEAGYAFGLQAVGVPSAVAISTAIAFRLVTFYIPPLWGSLAMRWLRRNAYV